jgi:hypothetical protein
VRDAAIGRTVETLASLAEPAASGIDKSELTGLLVPSDAAALRPIAPFAGAAEDGRGARFEGSGARPPAASAKLGDAGLFERALPFADPRGGGWAGSPAATRCREPEVSRGSRPSLPGGVFPDFTARTPPRRPPWPLPQVRHRPAFHYSSRSIKLVTADSDRESRTLSANMAKGRSAGGKSLHHVSPKYGETPKTRSSRRIRRSWRAPP